MRDRRVKGSPKRALAHIELNTKPDCRIHYEIISKIAQREDSPRFDKSEKKGERERKEVITVADRVVWGGNIRLGEGIV